MLPRFLDADQAVDEVPTAVTTMLAASPEPRAEEWAIHDYAVEATHWTGWTVRLDCALVAGVRVQDGEPVSEVDPPPGGLCARRHHAGVIELEATTHELLLRGPGLAAKVAGPATRGALAGLSKSSRPVPAGFG